MIGRKSCNQGVGYDHANLEGIAHSTASCHYELDDWTFGSRCAGPRAGAVDGDFAERHRGGGIAAGSAGGSAHTRTRRQRRGCGDRDERDDGRGFADDEWDRRRPLRDCVRCKGQQTIRIERERMGTERADHRVFAQAGIAGNAATGSERNYSAGRGGWMAKAGGQIWAKEAGGRPGGGDSDGAGRISGDGTRGGLLGLRSGSLARRRGRGDDVSDFGSGAADGRSVSKSRLGRVLAADRGAWARGVLQRRDREQDCRQHEAPWRDDDGGGPGGVFGRVGGTYFHDVSRLDGVRAAAECARARRARNAEHHGDVSAGAEGLGLRLDESAARHDRSEEAGVRGFGALRRRSAKTKIAGGAIAFERVDQPESETDRSGPRELRRARRRIARRQRHNVLERGGSRRQHGFAHSEQLRRLWIRDCRCGNGFRTAQPRRVVQSRCGFTECAGGPQTAAAYDHSRVCAEGRCADGIWDYGRLEPVAGARAVRGERRRLQDEYSGSAGGATIQQAYVRRVRRRDGEPLRAKYAK